MYINAFVYNSSFYGCSVSDEPTSPSIDLKAKHIPASSVVSSAMNSAPVLSASPSSPTFTFAMNRHYSQDCSKYLANIAFLELELFKLGLQTGLQTSRKLQDDSKQLTFLYSIAAICYISSFLQLSLIALPLAQSISLLQLAIVKKSKGVAKLSKLCNKIMLVLREIQTLLAIFISFTYMQFFTACSYQVVA